MAEDDDGRELPAEIWPALANKLWHATHVEKALVIVADGEIRPDAVGKYTNGYCRSLGGVSLFDFRNGDENARRVVHCGWTRWLGGHHEYGEDEIGVWFDLNPALASPHIAESAIYAHFRANRTYDENDNLLVRDPMPRCEGCHFGSIPLDAVNGLLLIDGRRLADYEFAASGTNWSRAIADFRALVRAKPPLPPTLADILQEARMPKCGDTEREG